MRKLVNHYGEHLEPVTLYLDDLEQIVEVLHQVSDSVEISTGDFALNDLKQLVELKRESLNKLEIGIDEPYISLNLEPHQIWLYINKDEPTSRGVFEQIKDILTRRKRPFAWLFHSSWIVGVLPALAGGLPVLGILLLIGGIANSNWLYILSGSFIIVVPILGAWYGFQEAFRRYSIIVPKYRIEAPSFFKRNADTIILSIISALLGGIITLVVVKLTGARP